MPLSGQKLQTNPTAMHDFAILTNRKRALIALVHSVVFLGVALHGFAAPRAAASLHGSGAGVSIALIVIYLAVASILAWLVTISGCLRERIYFSFCACSATFGLFRTVFGDTHLPTAQYMRVMMLTCAVIAGARIIRSYSRAVTETLTSD